MHLPPTNLDESLPDGARVRVLACDCDPHHRDQTGVVRTGHTRKDFYGRWHVSGYAVRLDAGSICPDALVTPEAEPIS